jgi:hypothetical protein
MGENIPKFHKTYQMYKNIPTSSIARPSKIDPNCDFWSENIPSELNWADDQIGFSATLISSKMGT